MVEQQVRYVDDRHAILSIAIKPRDTIQYVLKTKNLPYFLFIGIIGMFSSNVASFIGSTFDGKYSLGDIIYSSFMSSFLLYFLSTFIVAGIFLLSAKMLGGKGTFKQMFRVVSITMIPYIWILPLLLFWMQFAPQSFFDISYIETGLGDVILQFVGYVFILIASIWTYALTIIGISEVHKITKWRAFFASILVLIVLCAILVFTLL
ncbi:YIP1 family protein [Solibacillus sp. R5-41]|uniref:Yip1 family protein n=1 Tax=Solibacillus sp. R5-41 TaxID=2048654 RepID=UPI000C124A7B|nr:Yip1 family protein [Solibacillus sp. R5-41]ATP41460.1 YIP1 family protein [Solibacillus sp. R5-41]